MPAISTRLALDKKVAGGCSIPGCDQCAQEPLYLHAACHLDGEIEASYKNGVLTIACRECHKPVVSVEVK